MSKQTTIKGKISGEAFEFAQSILNDLQGHGWLKRAIKEGLAHDPNEARDGALLIYTALGMRVGETVDGES